VHAGILVAKERAKRWRRGAHLPRTAQGKLSSDSIAFVSAVSSTCACLQCTPESLRICIFAPVVCQPRAAGNTKPRARRTQQGGRLFYSHWQPAFFTHRVAS
jgi:hypothetical protein